MNKIIYAVGVAVVSTLISNATVTTKAKSVEKEKTKVENIEKPAQTIKSDSLQVTL